MSVLFVCSGPYLLPANTWVAVAAMATHYDEKLWDRPSEFRPERWSAPLKHPFQYIPFSSGARNCVGARFGEIEALSVVAHMRTPTSP